MTSVGGTNLTTGQLECLHYYLSGAPFTGAQSARKVWTLKTSQKTGNDTLRVFSAAFSQPLSRDLISAIFNHREILSMTKYIRCLETIPVRQVKVTFIELCSFFYVFRTSKCCSRTYSPSQQCWKTLFNFPGKARLKIFLFPDSLCVLYNEHVKLCASKSTWSPG